MALTAPRARSFGTTTTAYGTTAPPGTASTFAVTAADLVGNAATSAVTRTPALLAETSASRAGRWTTRTGAASSYLGGRAVRSTARGAKLTFTFTGRAMGLVVTRTATSGRADVYVNGTKVTTLDLKSSSTAYRQVVYVREISGAPARATVQIVNQATPGRPGIIVDGLTYVK